MNQRISVNGLKKNDIVEYYGRKWIFLGVRADGKEAYFGTQYKYAHYAQVIDGGIVMIGLSRMDATPVEVCEAHGF